MTARVGVWFIGARGSVATTATVGALALKAGLTRETGLVSTLPEVAVAGLVDAGDLVLGGHDLSGDPLLKRAERLVDSGVVPSALVAALRAEIEEVDRQVRPGIDAHDVPQPDAVARIEQDLRSFREQHRLDRVVVVDVASTERPAPDDPALASLEALHAAWARGQSPLPTSALYAYAAYSAGCPLVAFTPSPGPTVPAVAELAERQGLPWAGTDGKTGETLVKSALAPMFATRALQVRSWASYNLLGGGDGRTLADPAAAASKISTKGEGLEAMLGHRVDGPLHIDYVPDLGDWKTAWDHVSFEGFLGVRMKMQFTWEGCDSALAAPLVLDLARLVARAHQVGRVGPIGALGFFFKSPVGSTEHRLSAQWDALTDFCAGLGAAG